MKLDLDLFHSVLFIRPPPSYGNAVPIDQIFELLGAFYRFPSVKVETVSRESRNTLTCLRVPNASLTDDTLLKIAFVLFPSCCSCLVSKCTTFSRFKFSLRGSLVSLDIDLVTGLRECSFSSLTAGLLFNFFQVNPIIVLLRVAILAGLEIVLLHSIVIYNSKIKCEFHCRKQCDIFK